MSFVDVVHNPFAASAQAMAQPTRTICREPTTKHIPIILVTTKDQDTDRMWGMRQGAKAYLTKPFSETELSDTITRYVAGY